MAFIPAAHQIKTNYNYVSSLDVHKLEFDPELTMRYGSQFLTELLGMLGRKVPTSSLEYNHFEEDFIMPKVKATTAGAGAGATAIFTIDAAAAISVPQDFSPYIGSGAVTVDGVPVRVNDVIMIRGGSNTTDYVRAFVTAVDPSAPSFDAIPIDATDSIPAIVSAQEIIIIGNAFGEGSDQPAGRNSRTLKFTNNLQIIKESYDITGSENDVVLWFQTTDKYGRKGWTWTLKGEGDTYKRFLNYRELQLLLAEKLTNTTLADAQATAGTPIRLTEGLIPFILSQGIELNYTGVSGFTLTDIDKLIVRLDKEKGAKENFMYCGIQLAINIDDMLTDVFKNGAVTYGAFNNQQDLAVNMQFSSFQRNNYVFHKKTYDVFNDQQTLGAEGFEFPNEAMVIPADYSVDYKTRETIPSLRVRYLQNPDGGESREIRHWVTGGASPSQTDSFDRYQSHYLSEIGFEGFGGQRFAYIAKV